MSIIELYFTYAIKCKGIDEIFPSKDISIVQRIKYNLTSKKERKSSLRRLLNDMKKFLVEYDSFYAYNWMCVESGCTIQSSN